MKPKVLLSHSISIGGSLNFHYHTLFFHQKEVDCFIFDNRSSAILDGFFISIFLQTDSSDVTQEDRYQSSDVGLPFIVMGPEVPNLS